MTTQMDPVRRAFLVNCAVLIVGAVLLLATPVTVSFPVRLVEALLVAFGVGVLVGVNALLLHQPTAAGAAADPAAPANPPLELVRTVVSAESLAFAHGFHLDTPAGEFGVVDDVVFDEDGRPVSLEVAWGWFGRDRRLIPVEAVIDLSASRGWLLIDPASLVDTESV